MIESDTIKLLNECNAGIKMGVSSIDDVIDHVHNRSMKMTLMSSKSEHTKLGNETHSMLNNYSDQGKAPNPVARGMSWVKANVQLAVDNSDKTVAGLITDGCNMGVKSLNKYLNQYEAAEERAKDIAKRLINLEKDLCDDMKEYL